MKKDMQWQQASQENVLSKDCFDMKENLVQSTVLR